MLKIIFREFIIFGLSVSLLPGLLLAVLSEQHSLGTLVYGGLRYAFSGPTYLDHGLLGFWLRIMMPYAVVQSIRAYYWSRRSLVGRKWAHLYFAGILAVLGLWSLAAAWDLFYLMYALGDIPGELGQFFEIEGSNLVIGFGAFLITFYCIRIFLHPSENLKYHRGSTPL